MALSPCCAAAPPASSKRPAQMNEAYFIVVLQALRPLVRIAIMSQPSLYASPRFCGSMHGTKTKMMGRSMVGVLRAALLGLVSLLWYGTAPTFAGDYPNRPVHFINGFAPGGPVDTTARIMGQWLSDRLGQQFIIENRTGSGGNIAAAAAISSPADGYALLFVGANNAISTSLYKHLPFDFQRD